MHGADNIFDTISVIIPVKSGDDAWRALIHDLKPVLKRVEILLVCADCPDDMSNAITWVQGPGPRAGNLNAGVRAATRDFLWFVHADTRIKPNVFNAIHNTVTNQSPHPLYYFDLDFDQGPSTMFINAWGANFRSRILRIPFGDQAFLIHRKSFVDAGFYNELLPNSEDHYFVWQCHHAGIPLRRIPAHVTTSARRYTDEGWWHVVIKFQTQWIKDAMPQVLKLCRHKIGI